MNSGRVLVRARKRAGFTQKRLADLVALPQPAIARIESGRVTPRIDTLDRLLRACGYALETERVLGLGVDRTQFADLLRLSPRERLTRAAADAEGLRRLQAATRAGGQEANR